MGLILYTVFMIVIIFARIAIQYRITGDHGLRPANKDSSTLARVLSAFWIIALVAPWIVTGLDAFGIIQPQFDFGNTGLIIGTGLALAAIIIGFIAQLQMGASWRIGVDEEEHTALITDGIFAYVRNPIYSTVYLLAIGLVILIPHWAMLLSAVFAYFTIDTQVRYIEEPYLRQHHGESYVRDYFARVNRYFPNLLRNIYPNEDEPTPPRAAL